MANQVKRWPERVLIVLNDKMEQVGVGVYFRTQVWQDGKLIPGTDVEEPAIPADKASDQGWPLEKILGDAHAATAAANTELQKRCDALQREATEAAAKTEAAEKRTAILQEQLGERLAETVRERDRAREELGKLKA